MIMRVAERGLEHLRPIRTKSIESPEKKAELIANMATILQPDPEKHE